MPFESSTRWARSDYVQQAAIHPWLQIKPNRTNVAQDLTRRLLKRKIQAAFSPLACGVSKMSSKDRLSRTSSSRNKNTAVAEKALSAEHLIEAFKAAGDAIRRCFMC